MWCRHSKILVILALIVLFIFTYFYNTMSDTVRSTEIFTLLVLIIVL